MKLSFLNFTSLFLKALLWILKIITFSLHFTSIMNFENYGLLDRLTKGIYLPQRTTDTKIYSDLHI